jgi:acetoin utilization protein AcuB
MRFYTEFNIQHLPVADGGLLIGILSIKDVNKFVFQHTTAGEKVDIESLNAAFRITEVMTPNPVTVTPDDTAGRVVEILSAGLFQAIPVAVNGELQGIVTNKDLIRMLQWEYTHTHGSSFTHL